MKKTVQDRGSVSQPQNVQRSAQQQPDRDDPDKPGNVIIQVDIPHDLLADLDQIANASGMTRNALVVRFLETGLAFESMLSRGTDDNKLAGPVFGAMMAPVVLPE